MAETVHVFGVADAATARLPVVDPEIFVFALGVADAGASRSENPAALPSCWVPEHAASDAAVTRASRARPVVPSVGVFMDGRFSDTRCHKGRNGRKAAV